MRNVTVDDAALNKLLLELAEKGKGAEGGKDPKEQEQEKEKEKEKKEKEKKKKK